MTTLRDISLLLARFILGGILIAHGWQKFNDWGIDGTTEAFRGMGVPSPELAATFTTYFELIGGLMIILGLLVRFVGPILVVVMAGAFWYAHRDAGMAAAEGGWEVVALIAAAGFLLAGAGAGRFSIDHIFVEPFRKRRAQKKIEEAREKGLAVQHADGTVSYPADAAPAHTQQQPVQQQPVQQAPAQQPVQQQPVQQDHNTHRGTTNTDGHTVIADQEPTNNFGTDQR